MVMGLQKTLKKNYRLKLLAEEGKGRIRINAIVKPCRWITSSHFSLCTTNKEQSMVVSR